MIRPAYCLLLLGLLLPTVGRADGGVQSIEPDDATGSAKAVVVDPAPLLHTAQLLPLDEKGRIVGKGQLAEQVAKLVDSLKGILESENTSLDRLAKVNVYVVRPELAAEVLKAFGRQFTGKAKPAVNLVVSALPHPDALVALDAVAISGRNFGAGVTPIFTTRLITSGHCAAVLADGPRVYIAGQAEKGNLLEATRATLESLRKTLTFLGLKEADVVQLKAFLTPMTAAGEVAKEVEKFFGKVAVPPMVFVEWQSTLPIEIELIAHAGRAKARSTDVIDYLTPPGMTASPIYSRVARINGGKTIYISGLYGKSGAGAEAEVQDLFATLGGLLDKAGSDFRHMAKATYYVSTDDTSRKLNELRPRYYDPRRPPSASKAQVVAVGPKEKAIALDMIAVPSPLRAEGKPEHGHGLTADQAADGWISLFDGTTTFGWIAAKVDGKQLIGGKTTTEFDSFALLADFPKEGTITFNGVVKKVPSGKSFLAFSGRRGAIQLGEGVAVRTLLLQPLELKPLFNGKDLTGWKRIDRANLPENKRPVWKVTDGQIEAVGGPGALEYQDQKYGDLTAQLVVRSRARHANGGFFFRSIPGDFMNGYEAQIYNCCENGDPAKTSKWSTGALDDRQSARRLVSRDYEFFTMTVIAHGPHIATWVNGHQLTDWTDTRAKHENPRQGLRTEAGTLQLQAHDPATDVVFRSIRAAELK